MEQQTIQYQKEFDKLYCKTQRDNQDWGMASMDSNYWNNILHYGQDKNSIIHRMLWKLLTQQSHECLKSKTQTQPVQYVNFNWT